MARRNGSTPSTSRAHGAARRRALGAIAATATLVAGLSGCVGGEGAACAALTAPTPGLTTITGADGTALAADADWTTMLTEGVRHGGPETRTRMAAVVARNPDELAALIDTVPDDVRPAVERLAALAADPATGASAADAPSTVADVRALMRVSLDSDCGA